MKKIFPLLFFLFSFSGFSCAFDTGSHFDLTRSVLAERGFGDTAIKVVQVENWLTDYYSSTPSVRGAARDELEKRILTTCSVPPRPHVTGHG
jgi:hypothetical protein